MAARAWVGVAAAHVIASVVVSVSVARMGPGWLHGLDWEGGVVAALQPWRMFTAAWVHWSPQHLAMNLVGAAALAVLGWTTGLPRRAAFAWLLAWPLSQVVISMAASAPAHLGGLSGALHAGAAVAAVWALRRGRTRGVGALLVAGLVGKLAWEWLRGPQPISGADAVTWPPIHLVGSLCGAAIAAVMSRPSRPRR